MDYVALYVLKNLITVRYQERMQVWQAEMNLIYIKIELNIIYKLHSLIFITSD